MRHRCTQNSKNPTESDFRDFIAQAADEGFDTVHFRTSGVGRVCYPSKVMTPFDAEYRLESLSLAELLTQCDPLEVAMDACRERACNSL